MTDTLKVVPSTDDVKTGVKDVKAVTDGLTDVLTDTYRLIFKTHAYHWNVTGPLFYSVHKMTEEQYEDMFKAADDLAERIRALGQLAPIELQEIMARSHVGDRSSVPSAGEMIEDLAADHERVAKRLHLLVEKADESRDPVTEDLATERSAFHEEAAWMLRALGTS